MLHRAALTLCVCPACCRLLTIVLCGVCTCVLCAVCCVRCAVYCVRCVGPASGGMVIAKIKVTWNLLKGRPAYTTNLKESATLVSWFDQGNSYALGFDKAVHLYVCVNNPCLCGSNLCCCQLPTCKSTTLASVVLTSTLYCRQPSGINISLDASAPRLPLPACYRPFPRCLCPTATVTCVLPTFPSMPLTCMLLLSPLHFHIDCMCCCHAVYCTCCV